MKVLKPLLGVLLSSVMALSAHAQHCVGNGRAGAASAQSYGRPQDRDDRDAPADQNTLR